MNKLIKYLVLVFIVLLLIFIPERIIFQDQSLCIFKYVTGIECPLCGMTRASYLMLHLKAASAFTFNPLVFMLPLLLIPEILSDITKTPFMRQLRKMVWIIFAGGMLALFVVRFIKFFAN